MSFHIVTLQPVPDEPGLKPALAALISKNNDRRMQITLQNSVLSENDDVPAEIIRAILHIVQEALTNVSLHACVNEATVKTWMTKGNINVQIEDSGIGFDPGNIMFTCFGLNSMYETSCLVQGKLTVESAPGCGTRIIARFPVPKRSRRV